ncbi:Cof-type HAD-IIB family hydrolase [Erysipelotrichaceae bacterium OttesenSCG-928-M19]|nr:Cof-type HAD-IIB family hydrolase [Erysipelotrichaceae bacterium OttesenSCG-928-M19]
MKDKLIFFDIDGTIIDHYKKEIPRTTITALKRLQANNHKIVIASGKGPVFIENLFNEIKIDTYIALNGNYVVYNNKVIYKEYLPENEVKAFCDYCLNNNIAFVVSDEYSTKTLYKNDARVQEYYDEFTTPYPKVINEINDYSIYMQMSVMIAQEDEKHLISLFPKLTFVRMSEFGMNVIPKNGMKEKGVIQILEHSHYQKEDTIAFGDGLNDISMFKLVNTSVAMGNANQKTKDNATLITDHISNDGLYKVCKKLNLF